MEKINTEILPQDHTYQSALHPQGIHQSHQKPLINPHSTPKKPFENPLAISLLTPHATSKTNPLVIPLIYPITDPLIDPLVDPLATPFIDTLLYPSTIKWRLK